MMLHHSRATQPITHRKMASITKHNDRWRAHVFVHGVRSTKVFDKRRDAQAWASSKEKELDGLRSVSGMTWAMACEKYLATAAQEKAPGAADWEARRLDEFAAYFGADTSLTAITSVKLGEWRDARLTGLHAAFPRPISGSTVIRHFSVLRCIFRVALEEWKVIDTNPCKGVRMPEHAPPRHQVWSWKQIKRVLRSERDDNTQQTIRAFHIALHTGMRLNEILAARVVGKVAILERDKGSGKASPPIKVPLARKGAALFAKYPAFTIRPDIASALFSELTDQLLIDGLTFHDSRATALTLLSRRMDVLTLSRISRHRDLKILMRSYYRESAEQIAARI